MEGNKKLWALFRSMFVISAFTLGGGYVMTPLMKKKYVDELGWLEEKEMLDIMAISSSSPGIIAVNTSIMAGFRMAGAPGAAVALMGVVLPPLITISAIYYFYEALIENAYVAAALSGMQAGVAAMLASVVWGMAAGVAKKKDMADMAVMVGAFVAAYVFRVHVIPVVLICGALGLIRSEAAARRKAGP